MHLRDGGSGGAAFETASHEAPSFGLNGNLSGNTSEESSSRIVALKSNTTVTAGELLLAWILLLYRDNDDRSAPVNWGSLGVDQHSSPATKRSLDFKDLPFSRNDGLAKAVQAVQQLGERDASQELRAQQTLYFNDGASAQGSAGKGQVSCEWTYQIEVTSLQQELVVRARWDSAATSNCLAITRLESFIDIVNTTIDYPSQLVSDAMAPKRADLDQLWTWNAALPPRIDSCMHEFIAEKAASQPLTLAIESWDGTFTYAEIEELSTRLALHLVTRGAQVGEIIPLCFEKSKWTIVGLLAVMKAGCAFALTDPSQPEARLRTIVEQTEARFLLTSQLQSTVGEKIAGAETQRITVSPALFENLEPDTSATLPKIPGDSPLYIQFTSGSTGKPKGVMCSHANYSSGAVPRAEAVGYRPHSRVFDFASYAFDVSIDCMLCTLANGGCLCIPSDEDRMNDLSDAIRKSRCNMAHMTPSVARVLDSDVIPSLEVLGLGGEAVSAGDAAAWSRTAKVIIAYGPSECTVGCTVNSDVGLSTNIGKGVGGLTWIVDPEDHDRLMPVGAVGELLVEGPVVGLGYLNDPAKTAEVFVEDPAWLLAGGSVAPGRHGRLYKTGDLVRYDPDGTGAIVFVGRKDQQVKLRGQRIELAEVEHHLRAKVPSSVKLAAEVIKPGGGEPTLVAFIVEQDQPANDSGGDTTTLSSELGRIIGEIDSVLGAEIPRYMVPSSYIPLRQMPSLVSGKIDRKRLRELGSSMTREEVARMRVSSGESSEPETEMEKALQRAWTKVLGGDGEIGLHDSFFALGGDSLRAMRLVAAARDEKVSLTVAGIFNFPILRSMAQNAKMVSDEMVDDVSPFSLLEDSWSKETACAEVAKLCGIEASTVEDIYPCTPLQEGLMALSAKVKEAYVAQRVVDLEDQTSAEKLRAAFNVAAEDCTILRTRIVQVPRHGLVQVVVKEDIAWHQGDNLGKYLEEDREASMELGKPLVRYALITDSASNKTSFVLSMHHALYDGWSMPLVVDKVNKAYDGQRVKRPAEFKNFIKYLDSTSTQDAEKFWKDKLEGASGPQFPTLPYTGYQTQADSLLEVHVKLPGRPASNNTVATLIRGAWAYVASRYSASTDVVFGETLTGRNAPIQGAEEIEGPMITTVPLRVQVDDQASVADYLHEIQDQTIQQIPYEHTGLQHIRRLSPDAYEACELKTGLVLHPKAEADGDVVEGSYPANRLVPAGDSEAAQEALKFNTYALMLVCSLDADGFLVMASFDCNTVEKQVMERVLDHFARVSRQMCEMIEEPLGNIADLATHERAEADRLATANPQSVGPEYSDVKGVWVVDPTDVSKSVPVGALGELIVASTAKLSLPVVEQPVCSDPSEATSETVGSARFYRTGRLAKLGYDGIVHLSEVRSETTKFARPPVKRISAASAKQKRLRSLWSRVLKLPESDIGLNDSFFRLGGDSIAAMKLVSEARVEGLLLGVTQIFQNRSLYDMASVAEDSEPASSAQQESKALKPFELVEGLDAPALIREKVVPMLADPSWKVVDVLPTRPLQDVAIRGTVQLPRFSARYEAMYFSDAVDRKQLFKACQELVATNEILRTVFVAHGETYLGAVIENIQAPIEELEIDGDVETFVHELCRRDIEGEMPLGSCFVKWLFVQSRAGPSALVFRISHAQYDEICLPILLRQLSALHEGKTVPSALPFSSYVGHLVKKNIPESIPYWRDLLRGSSLSVLKPSTPIEKRDHFAIHREMDISSRSRDVTIATLPTAAWALCLARRLSSRDVTFGEVVSGRNLDFPNADAVVGPCWQYVPVRVRFEPGWTVSDLLAYVQDQHIASSAHEGVGLPEVAAANCANWPEGSADWFDSVVHQDVEHVENLGFASTSGRMETIYPHAEPLREWKVQAFPAGQALTIEIVTVESWAEHAKELLGEMEEIVKLLVRRPDAVLFE